MKAWLLDRLSERNTWGALLTLAGVVMGRAFAPDQAEAITTIGLLVAGGIGVVSKER
jgi:hypothetical protein